MTQMHLCRLLSCTLSALTSGSYVLALCAILKPAFPKRASSSDRAKSSEEIAYERFHDAEEALASNGESWLHLIGSGDDCCLGCRVCMRFTAKFQKATPWAYGTYRIRANAKTTQMYFYSRTLKEHAASKQHVQSEDWIADPSSVPEDVEFRTPQPSTPPASSSGHLVNVVGSEPRSSHEQTADRPPPLPQSWSAPSASASEPGCKRFCKLPQLLCRFSARILLL